MYIRNQAIQTVNILLRVIKGDFSGSVLKQLSDSMDILYDIANGA